MALEGLLTCICPTQQKRRRLIPAALRTFARQTLQEKFLLDATVPLIPWLVVGIDRGEERYGMFIADAAKAFGILTRIVVTEGKTLGAKRNELCKQAPPGSWITCWDDDDWSRPDRLALTVDAIEQVLHDREAIEDAGKPTILGSRSMLIHEIVDPRRRTFRYTFGGKEYYFVGGLLAFERALWERFPFAETGEGATVGDECWWQLSLPQDQIQRIEFTRDPEIYCAFIHNNNTANTSPGIGDPNWKPIDKIVLEAAMGSELELWENSHVALLLDPFVTKG